MPEDVAVCGFDDIPTARYVTPPLTTVQLPAYGLGWAAAEMLIRMIAKEALNNPHLILNAELDCPQFLVELISRESLPKDVSLDYLNKR